MPYLCTCNRCVSKYNKKIQRGFPNVRVRWSDQLDAWQLEERRTRSRANVDPDKYPVEAIDTFIRARDGYYLVREVEQPFLPTTDRMIHALQANDRRRRLSDNADVVETALRNREIQEERRKRERRRDLCHAAGSELYDARWTSHRPTEGYHG